MKTPFSYSPQNGTPGHCTVAQVFDADGNSIAEIEPTENQIDATEIAKLFASAPKLVEALERIANTCEHFDGCPVGPNTIAEVARAALAEIEKEGQEG